MVLVIRSQVHLFKDSIFKISFTPSSLTFGLLLQGKKLYKVQFWLLVLTLVQFKGSSEIIFYLGVPWTKPNVLFRFHFFPSFSLVVYE